MAFNVLIVDDSAIMRSIVARTIKMAGIPVGDLFMAGNGEEGLKTISENWVDVVFIDINMPVMDGMAMMEKMSADEVMKNLPVIVISTEGSETKIEKLRKMGMKAFIRKPFTPEKLRSIMRELLGDWDGKDGIRPDAARDGSEDF